MEWTAEADVRLRELHAKRVSGAFIASWMRWPPGAVRERLIALGLAKPAAPRGSTVTAAVATPRADRLLPADDDFNDAFEDEQPLKTAHGCSPGHLLPETKIAALYRGAGSDYRRG